MKICLPASYIWCPQQWVWGGWALVPGQWGQWQWDTHQILGSGRRGCQEVKFCRSANPTPPDQPASWTTTPSVHKNHMQGQGGLCQAASPWLGAAGLVKPSTAQVAPCVWAGQGQRTHHRLDKIILRAESSTQAIFCLPSLANKYHIHTNI